RRAASPARPWESAGIHRCEKVSAERLPAGRPRWAAARGGMASELRSAPAQTRKALPTMRSATPGESGVSFRLAHRECDIPDARAAADVEHAHNVLVGH